MLNYSIAVDWLQVYCENSNYGVIDFSDIYSPYYSFVRQPCSSRQFEYIYNVYDSECELYAVVQSHPFSKIINKKGCIVKLANRELYKRNFSARFLDFLNIFQLKYKSISRLDVCFDCNAFVNGMTPRKLISSLMKGSILKNNQGRAAIEFETHKVGQWQGIRFGSATSAVTTVLYNKTKELAEVKDKPYIRELWWLNGVDDTREVWRVEIRIKSDATNVVRTDTGEIFRLSPDSVRTDKLIEDVFFSYAKQYFAFKRNNGTRNKSRMPDVRLFPERKITTKAVRITQASDATRSDRIFLRKLCSLEYELREVPDELRRHIDQVRRDFCLQKKMTEYYRDRVFPQLSKYRG